MESLRNAILLNNVGVRHLDCSNVNGAMHSFQCAVAAVKVAIAMSTDPNVLMLDQPPTTTTTTVPPRFPPHGKNADNHDEILSSSIYQASKSKTATTASFATNTEVQATVAVLPQQPSTSALLDGINVGISYIYNRPFLISTDISIQNMDHMNSVVATASTYIIFNFALTCHVVGKQTGNERYMIRAMRLYELTLKVLHTAQSSSGCSPYVREMHSVLECLTLNNFVDELLR